MVKEIILEAVHIDGWSYIKNQNGNMQRTTLMGWGSCTPVDVLQEYINGLSEKGREETSKLCDEVKDV